MSHWLSFAYWMNSITRPMLAKYFHSCNKRISILCISISFARLINSCAYSSNHVRLLSLPDQSQYGLDCLTRRKSSFTAIGFFCFDGLMTWAIPGSFLKPVSESGGNLLRTTLFLLPAASFGNLHVGAVEVSKACSQRIPVKACRLESPDKQSCLFYMAASFPTPNGFQSCRR